MRASVAGAVSLAALAATLALPGPAAVAGGDTTAPVVESVAAPSKVVKKRSGVAAFRVRVAATDRGQITDVVVAVRKVGYDGKPRRVGVAHDPTLGYTDDGTWKVRVRMPAKLPAGRWEVFAYALDAGLNMSADPLRVRDVVRVKNRT